MKSLITKQIELMTTIASLQSAAISIDSQEILLYTKDTKGNIIPLTDAYTQGLMLTDATLTELRGSALEALDQAVIQLDALGVTFSPEALSEVSSTPTSDSE